MKREPMLTKSEGTLPHRTNRSQPVDHPPTAAEKDVEGGVNKIQRDTVLPIFQDVDNQPRDKVM